MGRVFSFVAMILVLAAGMYIYSRQVKAISPTTANNPKATVNLVGVRMDLSNIANAEKRYMASEGHYGSLDDLISSQVISETRHRGPYTYSVDVNGENFRSDRDPGSERRSRFAGDDVDQSGFAGNELDYCDRSELFCGRCFLNSSAFALRGMAAA